MGVKKAPGELELVRTFASTVARGKRADALPTPAKLGRWLEQRGLLDGEITLDQAQHRRALDMRRGLRALILVNSGVEADAAALDRFEEIAATARFSLRFDAGAPVGFGPASYRFDDALGSIAGIVTMARLDGRWPHLKICAESSCGLAFFDTSPNHTGRWCSPPCGDRYRAATRRASGR